MVRERQVPEPVAGRHDWLIDILACGICRNDLHVIDGELSYPKPDRTLRMGGDAQRIGIYFGAAAHLVTQVDERLAESIMSQKGSKNAIEATRTAESALGELLTHIKDLVERKLLDSRCATKLVRRIKKEYVLISQSGKLTKPGDRLLQGAFEAVDAALNAENARLLVEANAVLRAEDKARGGDSGRRGVEVFGTTTD